MHQSGLTVMEDGKRYMLPQPDGDSLKPLSINSLIILIRLLVLCCGGLPLHYVGNGSGCWTKFSDYPSF